MREGRTGTLGSDHSRAQIQLLEFGCYLTDSNESWEIFDQVMGNLEQTGVGFFSAEVLVREKSIGKTENV